ncbi:MAG: chloride channel protein, partial [Deltaproteobacteria bacterium]
MAESRVSTEGRRNRRIDERVVLALLAAVVGLCAGGAAVLLSRLLHLASELFSIDREPGWQVAVLPALGAAAAVSLARYLFRDHQGHGVPEVIYSVGRRGGLMRRRTILSRLLGCVLTLGSGGSAGPEAPVVAIGGATGSTLGQWLHVKERWRTVLVCCGAAAAIAAIFNAPATGIVFVFEAILEQWAPLSMVPVAIASVVGTEVSRFFSGNQIPFRGANLWAGWMDLTACVGLALLCALVAVALMRALRLVGRAGKRLGLNPVALAAAGGLAVGAIGYFMPEALGEG